MVLKGFYSRPYISLAFSNNLLDNSISIAPPPGTNFGSDKIFLATPKASWRFLSISFKVSFEPPLNKIEQAEGSLQSSKKLKYSSPIFLT